jgi:hypothetical protein
MEKSRHDMPPETGHGLNGPDTAMAGSAMECRYFNQYKYMA